ncbi:hypothetical protein PN488_21925 [Nodularia spumigena CS-591/12]|uniref:hypothetical protein n=1 Tax=Nodularia spumigena TaxID=70799 RepID=UPI00232CC721|nr:hypothetical protein [Nodularia spumigena]MDB9306992.1 hypothetical protein [Nodularia spumigena CS-591/12]MDB9345371.1 hypothetical protein [Nodularia spumigena CS-588/06]MDB9369778.1 hypothetical protein [Nodularia spumigena CS-586/05]
MNKYLIIGIILTFLGEALISKTSAQPPSCIANSLPAVTKPANSDSQGNVIVIGKVTARPYVVVVPNQSVTALDTAKKYNNYAFLAQHRLGPFIYAGGFAKRQQAECLSNLLRYHGLDARVVYFR